MRSDATAPLCLAESTVWPCRDPASAAHRDCTSGRSRARGPAAYGGEALPLTYDEVAHYPCCEPSVFNIESNEHMLWFYALKDGWWHYVEIGVYDE